MRNDITQTDLEIEAAFKTAFRADLTVEDLVFTRDTIENFEVARNNYAETGSLQTGSVGSFKTLELSRVQARKGDPRKDVQIIDFGSIRACYQ